MYILMYKLRFCPSCNLYKEPVQVATHTRLQLVQNLNLYITYILFNKSILLHELYIQSLRRIFWALGIF